jgi:hypothetical protein
MATFQTTYSEVPAIGLPGQLANTELSNVISRTVESAAGIAFGQPAYRGSGDHGVIAGGTFAAAATSEALGTNTGNGTMGAVTVSAGAKQGVYTLTIIEPGANVGTFIVTDPDGDQIGDGVVGSAFSAGGLAFTLADGSTDFVAGDSFAITVVYTANAKFMGITRLYAAVLDKASTPDSYEQYETAAIITQGQIYVTAGATVADGDAVYWNPANGRFTNTATHIAIPDAVFDTSGVNGDIVEISLKLR